ncbi:hypothetical protein PanWU01x14_169300, partial [Parasponia andersonii]
MPLVSAFVDVRIVASSCFHLGAYLAITGVWSICKTSVANCWDGADWTPGGGTTQRQPKRLRRILAVKSAFWPIRERERS